MGEACIGRVAKLLIASGAVSRKSHSERTTKTFSDSIQYAEKVRELSRFIEPLRQKIAAMGREDDEKLAKMRRLLEILCNPSNKRLPMETLKKCEAVLNRMQQTQDLGG